MKRARGPDIPTAAAAAQIVCDSWNAAHQIGAEVDVTMDNGEIRRTKTRSEAFVCNSGYAVIHLEGIVGYYVLKRVEPAP